MRPSRRVDHEAALLCIFEELVVEAQIGGISPVDHRLDVVHDDDSEGPTEEDPGGLEACDELVKGLRERQEHEHVAGVDRGEDERLRQRSNERALEAAARVAPQVPDPESAEALVNALPLLDVDWELHSRQDFRELLSALKFEASYLPTTRELTVRVTLVPDLARPDGPRAFHLFEPGRGIEPLTYSLRVNRSAD